MVWGCFSKKGVGDLVHIPTIMDKSVYEDILKNHLKKSARKLRLGSNYVFQQDNDPKHTAKTVQEWFRRNKINKMDWPAQSPDLNPIENLWSELGRKVARRDRAPKNSKELVAILQEEWNAIPKDVTAKLVESMPRRLEAVIAAHGGHTKY